jgi:hypothetical protein
MLALFCRINNAPYGYLWRLSLAQMCCTSRRRRRIDSPDIDPHIFRTPLAAACKLEIAQFVRQLGINKFVRQFGNEERPCGRRFRDSPPLRNGGLVSLVRVANESGAGEERCFPMGCFLGNQVRAVILSRPIIRWSTGHLVQPVTRNSHPK